MKLESKNRVYKLTKGAPLSCVIPSRSNKHKPLLYWDDNNQVNRPLRYARNQKSPFEDEQDGEAIIEPIIFESGMLQVPKNNPILQQFLHYHPLNGKKFMEVDKEKDAEAEVNKIVAEIDAAAAARNMSIEELEAMARVVLDVDVSTMQNSELKRAVLVFARTNPADFMDAISDPGSQMKATIKQFFEERLLTVRNKNRDVFFNLASNKKRLAVVPFGVDYIEYLLDWFKTEDGSEQYEYLLKQL